jgi:hypothetical protein
VENGPAGLGRTNATPKSAGGTLPSLHHLPAMRQPQVSGQPSAHQIGEIVATKMLSGRRRGGGQRRVEALERITSAFDVEDSRRRICRFEVSPGHNARHELLRLKLTRFR